jgi:hypothetical protein
VVNVATKICTHVRATSKPEPPPPPLEAGVKSSRLSFANFALSWPK